MPDPEVPDRDDDEFLGGEAPCYLNRVCEACGRLVESGDVCPACGAPMGVSDRTAPGGGVR